LSLLCGQRKQNSARGHAVSGNGSEPWQVRLVANKFAALPEAAAEFLRNVKVELLAGAS
jgi:hypothetical protein